MVTEKLLVENTNENPELPTELVDSALLGVTRLALRRFRGRERIGHGEFP